MNAIQPPQLVADLAYPAQAALREVGIHLGESEIAAIECEIFQCLPITDYKPYQWLVFDEVPKFAYIGIVSTDDTVHLMIGFRNLPTGDWEINAAYLAFAKKWQRQGHSNILARALIAIGRRQHASRIITIANIDVGSYAWARRMARPAQPEAVKAILIERIRRLEQLGFWSVDLADQSRRIVQGDDLDFMAKLAHLTSPATEPKRQPGLELLAEAVLDRWSWEAFWDLTDSAYIERVIKSLPE